MGKLDPVGSHERTKGAPMSTYCWDLGIDWDAAEDFDGDGDCLLQTGFVGFPQPGSPRDDSPVNLRTGDTVQFNIYDTTDTTDTYSVTFDSVQVETKCVDGQSTADCPFKDETSPFTLTPSSGGQVYSTPFEETLPVWNCPTLTIASGADGGRFVIKITVKATKTDGDGTETTKTWSVDPEMLIGTAG